MRAQSKPDKTIEQRVRTVKAIVERLKPPKRYRHTQGEIWEGTRKIRPWN